MLEHAVSGNGIDAYVLSQIDGQVTAGHAITDQPALAAIQAQALQVAELFSDFVGQAQNTLDICIYDFRLVIPAVSDVIVKAINDAAARGVAVRIAYDKDETDDQDIFKQFAGAGGDPAATGTRRYLAHAHLHPTVQVKAVAEEAINPGSQIMHNKFMVRDAASPTAAVWMGSTNFTVDAWALQENNIVVFAPAPSLAAGYAQDFTELWDAAKITGTGTASGTVTVGPDQVSYGFAPHGGTQIEALIAAAIAQATTRVRVASMVLSSVKILQALKDQLDAGIDVQGIYDFGETNQVRQSWSKIPADAAKVALLDAVTTHLVAKKSLPFVQDHPEWAHNFMHDKIAVGDDTVVTGSFNFSTNATRNAENAISVSDATAADAYASYIDSLVTRYGH